MGAGESKPSDSGYVNGATASDIVPDHSQAQQAQADVPAVPRSLGGNLLPTLPPPPHAPAVSPLTVAVANQGSSPPPAIPVFSPPPGPSRPWWNTVGDLQLPPMLEVLNLSNQAMGVKETRSMLRALACHKTVRELAVADNRMGDAGVELLAALLQHDHLIEKLDVSRNDISDKGVAHLARAIGGNPKLALVELRLAGNRLTDASAAALAQCVRFNSVLRRVDCSGNPNMTANGMHMVKAMRSRPALVEAGKLIDEDDEWDLCSPASQPGGVITHSAEVQFTDPRKQQQQQQQQHLLRAAHKLPSQPAATAFTLAPRRSELDYEPANFSAPSAPHALGAAMDDPSRFENDWLYAAPAPASVSAVPAAEPPAAKPRSLKAQAKAAEILSHEQRIGVELDAQLLTLRAQSVEQVNSALMETVFSLLRESDAQMSRFAELSVACRQGSIPVSTFYTYALETLGFSGLKQCIPAMIVALHSAPLQQQQLRRAHIEYCSVKALLAEKKQARGESTVGSVPSEAAPTEANAAASAPSALGVLQPAAQDEPPSSSDTPIFRQLPDVPHSEQQAPPLFPHAHQHTSASTIPAIPGVDAAPVHNSPEQTEGTSAQNGIPSSNAAATAVSAHGRINPQARHSHATSTAVSHSSGAVAAPAPYASLAASIPASTPTAPLPADPVPDSSVQYRFMQEKLARSQAAAAAKALAEEKEAAAAEKIRLKEEAAAQKKAAEAARKAEEQRKREQAKEEAAEKKRAAEAAKIAAAEAEIARREFEIAEKARIEQERREQFEAARRAREEQLAAEAAEHAARAARIVREAEEAAAAEAAALAAREEEERVARRARRQAEAERLAEAQRLADILEAEAAAEAARKKQARREAREAEKREAERARMAAAEAGAAQSAGTSAAAATSAVADESAPRSRRSSRSHRRDSDADAEAARAALLEELESSSHPAAHSTSTEAEREAKAKRKEEKRLKRAAKEERRAEREKEKERERERQQQQQAHSHIPPPTQFISPPPPPAFDPTASSNGHGAASSSSAPATPSEVVARWASRYTAQLPVIHLPPPPPPMPEPIMSPTSASSSFIAYEDEVKLRRAEAANRARIGALHAAYAQAQADAAKRDRDQAHIKADILSLLKNLHLVFPPLDEQGKPQPNQPYPFAVALQTDASPAAIKRAFLKASVQVHPDKQAKSNPQRAELSSLIFPILRDSYTHFCSKQ